MPELPDVQVFKEYLDATALHERIESVVVDGDRVLRDTTARALVRRLEGGELRSTRRHGKHLFSEVRGRGWLRLHFGMTGRLKYFKGAADEPDHTRLRLDFAGDYHLAYVNVRLFGEIGWVDDVDAFIDERGLGPDALEVDRDGFRDALAGRSGAVKSALMNQAVLAGVGNIYADEVLFQAGVNPGAKVDQLEQRTLGAIHRALREVLEAAIEARVQDFPDWFLLPHRDGDMTCPRCGGPLDKTKLSGRSTYFCPKDQKRRH